MDELLYCVKVADHSANMDLAWEMLSALELDFSSYEDRENHTLIHTAYSENEAEARENLERIQKIAAEWKSLGLETEEPEFFVLKKSEWAEVWKKYFKVIEISPNLAICPSWIDYAPKENQKVLTIDPGMTFGTGQHATTFFCLKSIDKLSRVLPHAVMLDAGCGSGILAIAGALLGYEAVDCFDYSADAVEISKENLALNHISNVTPELADAAEYPGRTGGYDLVCANILGHLLKAYRRNIASWVRPGKYLALAGILNAEFDGVSQAFQELGFEETERETLREWTSGLFRKKEPLK